MDGRIVINKGDVIVGFKERDKMEKKKISQQMRRREVYL